MGAWELRKAFWRTRPQTWDLKDEQELAQQRGEGGRKRLRFPGQEKREGLRVSEDLKM